MAENDRVPILSDDESGAQALLARAAEVVAAASAQPDLDSCLRVLRDGLLRLGVRRAGIWLLEPHNPVLIRGTWGTDWDGQAVDERALVMPLGRFLTPDQIASGQKVILRRLVRPPGPVAPHQARRLTGGPSNGATVVLRASGLLLGLLSVDTLPEGSPLTPAQIQAVEWVADHIAPFIARWRTIAALDERLVRQAVERTEEVRRTAEVAARQVLDRLASELIVILSHELRSPLSLVYGYTELLLARLDQLSRDDLRWMLQEVMAGARVLVTLLDELVDFVRLDQRALAPERRPVEVAALVAQMATASLAALDSRRIRVAVPAGLVVQADPVLLERALVHLLRNALTYAPEGPVWLRAGADDRDVWLEVADSGPGIPPEERERIWDAFYRGREVAGRATGRGLGLGLTLVRRLVEAQGGVVELRCPPEGGCVFRLVFPRDAAPA
jgi:signal transduction histidine kinase